MPRPQRGERQRFNRAWTDEQKLAIIEEVAQATCYGDRGMQAEVLRKHQITTAHIAIWKRVLRAKGKLPERLWKRHVPV